jgi:hypothetical protein
LINCSLLHVRNFWDTLAIAVQLNTVDLVNACAKFARNSRRAYGIFAHGDVWTWL